MLECVLPPPSPYLSAAQSSSARGPVEKERAFVPRPEQTAQLFIAMKCRGFPEQIVNKQAGLLRSGGAVEREAWQGYCWGCQREVLSPATERRAEWTPLHNIGQGGWMPTGEFRSQTLFLGTSRWDEKAVKRPVRNVKSRFKVKLGIDRGELRSRVLWIIHILASR